MGTIDMIRFTADDYRALPPEFPRVELIGGRFVELTPAPSDRHQSVVLCIGSCLHEHFRLGRLGIVRVAPYDVYLDAVNVLQPDVCAVLASHRDRVATEGVRGAPDLVVEVLSKSTAARDLAEKLAVYRAASVPEYWVVDPSAQIVHVYRLQESKERRSFHAGEALSSPLLPGFNPDVARFFED